MINKHNILLVVLTVFSVLNVMFAPRCLADDPIVIIFVGEMTYNPDHPFEPILHGVGGGPDSTPLQTMGQNVPCPIMIAFTNDIGQVAVMIENHTTGMYAQELTSSSRGVVAYQVPGTPGLYSVTVMRADGRSYSETFMIE